MPPRRRAPTPTPIDVESVRQKLADGKIVRVGVSKSAQFPAGATGRVRRVGDPAVDGEEYVQVELTLNGTRDVLPFNPSDLTPATRGRPPGQSVAPGPARRPQVGTASSRSLPAPPPAAPGSGGTAPPTTPTRHLTAVGRPVAATAENNGDGLADRDGAGSPTAAAQSPGTLSAVPNRAVSGPTPAMPGSPGHGEGTAPPAAKPKPVRGQKRSPAVSIIVATSDTEPPHWRIEAKVGARVVLRSGAVAPARVWELVQLLDNDTLVKAVRSILDEQRAAAQARADALAAELAQVRAELAALPGGTP